MNAFLPLKFVKNAVLLSLVLTLLSYGASLMLPKGFVTPVWPFLIAFFLAVTILIHYYMVRAFKGRAARTVNFFMLVTVIKLFLFMGIIVIYALSFKNDAVAFGIWFFVYYVIYTFFEVNGILKVSREKPQ